jgi:hypothetical protein
MVGCPSTGPGRRGAPSPALGRSMRRRSAGALIDQLHAIIGSSTARPCFLSTSPPGRVPLDQTPDHQHCDCRPGDASRLPFRPAGTQKSKKARGRDPGAMRRSPWLRSLGRSRRLNDPDDGADLLGRHVPAVRGSNSGLWAVWWRRTDAAGKQASAGAPRRHRCDCSLH